MEVAFYSEPGLWTSLQEVGFEMDVAQLSRDRPKRIFRLGSSRQLPVLSIQTNQDLLLRWVHNLTSNITRRVVPGVTKQRI